MDPGQPRPPAASAPRRQRAPRSPASNKRNNPNNNRQLGRPALESPPLPPLTTTVPTLLHSAARTRTPTLSHSLHGTPHDVPAAVVKRESIPELDRLAAAAAAVSAGGTSSPFAADSPYGRPRTGVANNTNHPHHHNTSVGLVGWSDRNHHPNQNHSARIDQSPRSKNLDNNNNNPYPYESQPSPRHPQLANSSSTMPAGPSSTSRLSVSHSTRGRRRSAHANAIIDIDPIILRERERMENERMQRELATDRDRRVGSGLAAMSSSNNNINAPPSHYSHQTLPAARPMSNDLAQLGMLSSNNNGPLPPPPHPFAAGPPPPGRPPLDTFPPDTSLRRRSSPTLERRRTSSLTINNPSHHPQHHRLPTTSAAPIASNANNSNSSSNVAGSSAASLAHNAYPGNQPSVMALPPGPGARIVDGPPGSNPGGVPPPGAVLIPSGGPGGPSVAGHHPHQVQSAHHQIHDNGAHDKMASLLNEVRSEYEAMQTDCMVLKGQRDEYENKSESLGGIWVDFQQSPRANAKRPLVSNFEPYSQPADSGDRTDQAGSL